MSLFQARTFVGHAGGVLDWKIDCDYLNSLDIACFAQLIARRVKFSYIWGIPRGGIMLYNALRDYANPSARDVLIVDDVLTTGKSMEHMKHTIGGVTAEENIKGIVIFARGPCPSWVIPVLSTNPFFETHVEDQPPSHKEYNQ